MKIRRQNNSRNKLGNDPINCLTFPLCFRAQSWCDRGTHLQNNPHGETMITGGILVHLICFEQKVNKGLIWQRSTEVRWDKKQSTADGRF